VVEALAADYGGCVLKEVETPSPGPGEVRVRVRAAAVKLPARRHTRGRGRAPGVYPFQVETALSRSEDGRNLEFSLLRKAVEPQTLEVRLLRPATLADEAAGVARRLQQHLDAELDVPTQVSFHDDLPRVGYKTLRVLDEHRA
jgi:hypothetical protein